PRGYIKLLKIQVRLKLYRRSFFNSRCSRNKKDERGIVVKNKALLVAQGHTHEKGTNYEEVFALVAKIEAIRLFLAYASFMGFMVYQMDVKSAFLYGTIKHFMVYIKLLELDGKSASTPIDTEKPLLKDPNGEVVDVHAYRSMIGSLMYLTSSRLDIMFTVCACAHFQVTPKASNLHAVKRIFRYLKGKPHLGLWYLKDLPFDLVAYSYSDYAGASLDRKSTTRGCQYFGCRLISWQCKKQTVVATSSTEAEYVVAASCCAQVLWIQNQLLDYGVKFQLLVQLNAVQRHILLDCIFLGFGLTMQVVQSGVNTPRCDKDRLDLIELKVFLLPSDEKVRIEVSAVDLQTFVAVKKVNDVTRLQALVDKKKVVITKASIKNALHLDDAEGVECLPNEEIFTELSRIGYEKPSTKLTFYKAFFSSQKQVGDLSSHSTKYTSPALTQKVFANMRRICKGFYRVNTPLFEGMLVAQEVGKDADEVHAKDVNATGVVTEGGASDDVNAAVDEPSIPSPPPPTPPPQPSQDIPSTSQDTRISMDFIQNLMDTCTTLSRRVEHLELDKIAQALEITKIDTSDGTVMDDVSKQGGIIANIDADEDVVLEDAKDVAVEKSADDEDNADIQGRKAKSQVEIYKIDLEHAKKVLSMQEEDSEQAELQEVVDVVTTAKIITKVVTAASDTITVASTTITAADVPISAATIITASTLTVAPSRRKKGVVIKDPQETATPSTIIHSEAKSEDKGKGILKEDNAVKRYQALKRKPQTEAQAKKNMMIYLRNVAGFKMDYFKGMTYDNIRPIFEKHFDSNVAFLQKTKEQMDEEDGRALKRLNETQEEKAAKKEDLDALWSLVKEQFATTKPKNFFEDFLLITLGDMFENPDIHAQI
nr:uncharacterized mitochondrial protein AtMg00810-like [Tanacetum cinerariifolium]